MEFESLYTILKIYILIFCILLFIICLPNDSLAIKDEQETQPLSQYIKKLSYVFTV